MSGEPTERRGFLRYLLGATAVVAVAAPTPALAEPPPPAVLDGGTP